MWDVFTKETESQEVRSHALRPLRQLLKLRAPSLAADKWEVKAHAYYVLGRFMFNWCSLWYTKALCLSLLGVETTNDVYI